MSCNSLFGFLALATYVATLIPSNLTKIFPHTRKWKINRWLLKKRRLIGLIAFSLSIDHALISFSKYSISLFHIKTYTTYYTGVSIFTIFTLLALTSNDWSIRKFKHKWHLLHKLTYVAIFLLIWHILSLMRDSWTFLTPIGLHISSVVAIMYLTRLIVTSFRAIQKKWRSLEEAPQVSRVSQVSQLSPKVIKAQTESCDEVEVSAIVKR